VAKRDLTLLGALFVTQKITLDEATALAEYLQHVDVQYKNHPETLEVAIDMALGFFRDDPDTEAAKTADSVQAEHDEEACPDCGGEMMDSVDMEQAVDLWLAVRMVADKYAFDREVSDHGEQEEC